MFENIEIGSKLVNESNLTYSYIFSNKKNQTPTKIENLARVQKFWLRFSNLGSNNKIQAKWLTFISLLHSWSKLKKWSLKVVRGRKRSNFNFYVKYANITEVQTSKEFLSLFESWPIIYKIDTYRFSFSKKEVFRSPEVIILLTLI